MSFKVFVRNVPKNATEELIREAFYEFGEVINVTIPCDKYTLKPRGFVYVVFKTKEAMDAALAKGSCNVMGATVSICPAKLSTHKEPDSRRLFIRGIPTNIKEEDLLKFFNSVGEVVLHIFPKDRNNGLLRNFCFITYKSVELTEKLLQDGYMMFNDQRLSVEPAKPRDELYPEAYRKLDANDRIAQIVSGEEYNPFDAPDDDGAFPPQGGYDYPPNSYVYPPDAYGAYQYPGDPNAPYPPMPYMPPPSGYPPQVDMNAPYQQPTDPNVPYGSTMPYQQPTDQSTYPPNSYQQPNDQNTPYPPPSTTYQQSGDAQATYQQSGEPTTTYPPSSTTYQQPTQTADSAAPYQANSYQQPNQSGDAPSTYPPNSLPNSNSNPNPTQAVESSVPYPSNPYQQPNTTSDATNTNANNATSQYPPANAPYQQPTQSTDPKNQYLPPNQSTESTNAPYPPTNAPFQQPTQPGDGSHYQPPNQGSDANAPYPPPAGASYHSSPPTNYPPHPNGYMNRMDNRDRGGMNQRAPPNGPQAPYNNPPNYPPNSQYPPPNYPPNGRYDYYGGNGYYPNDPYYQQNQYNGRHYERPRESNWDQRHSGERHNNWDRDGRHGSRERRSVDYRDSRRSNWDSRNDHHRDSRHDRSRSRSRSRPVEQQEDSDRIFVSGLDPHVTEQIIREHFQPYGRVKNVRLPVDHRTGRQRDIALITMDSAESVNRALREASHTIMGREVKQLCVSSIIRMSLVACFNKAK